MWRWRSYTSVLTGMHLAAEGVRAELVAAIVVTVGAVTIEVVGLPVGPATLLIGVLLALAVAHQVWSTRLRVQAEMDDAAPDEAVKRTRPPRG